MPANLKNQQWPQDWKRSVFIPIPKKGNAKEFSNYHTVALTLKFVYQILLFHAQIFVLSCVCDRSAEGGYRSVLSPKHMNRKCLGIKAGRKEIKNLIWSGFFFVLDGRLIRSGIYFLFIEFLLYNINMFFKSDFLKMRKSEMFPSFA